MKNLSNKRFGKITITTYSHKNKFRAHVWNYLCDCGNTGTTTVGYLNAGRTNSCGCSRTIHGMRRTRLYRIWSQMIQRCTNPNKDNYKYYGARGIKICKDWTDNFVNFSNWASANGYKDSLTIDRIDNNGHYQPDNCRWISMKEQCKNRRKANNEKD